MKHHLKFIRLIIFAILIFVAIGYKFERQTIRNFELSPLFLIDTSKSMQVDLKKNQINKIISNNQNIRFVDYNNSNFLERDDINYFVYVTDLFDNNFVNRNIGDYDKIVLLGKDINTNYEVVDIKENKKEIQFEFNNKISSNDSIKIISNKKKLKYAVLQNKIKIKKNQFTNIKNRLKIELGDRVFDFWVYINNKKSINVIIDKYNFDTRFFLGLLRENFNIKISKVVDTNSVNVWLASNSVKNKLLNSKRSLYILSNGKYPFLSKYIKPDIDSFPKVYFKPQGDYVSILNSSFPYFVLYGDSMAIFLGTDILINQIKSTIYDDKNLDYKRKIEPFLKIFLKKENFVIFQDNRGIFLFPLINRDGIDVEYITDKGLKNKVKMINGKFLLTRNSDSLFIKRLMFYKNGFNYDNSSIDTVFNFREQKTMLLNSVGLNSTILSKVIKLDSISFLKNRVVNQKVKSTFDASTSIVVLILLFILLTLTWYLELNYES